LNPKCPRCNGFLIYDRMVHPRGERLYCLQCGREAQADIEYEKGDKEKDMEKKTCKKCGKEFPATQEYFTPCGGGKYLENRCKECAQTDARARYLLDKSDIKVKNNPLPMNPLPPEKVKRGKRLVQKISSPTAMIVPLEIVDGIRRMRKQWGEEIVAAVKKVVEGY